MREGSVSPLAPFEITFAGSFPDPLVPLDPRLPEVAMIGRSNVGKSSLLNALTGRPGLARTSSTPGKTTLLNVFRLPHGYLVDLPGYGYAQRPKAERAAFRKLLEGYVGKRPTVAGIVWLLDIRHEPSKDDLVFQELLAKSGAPALPVLTKADKVPQGRRAARVRAIAEALGVAPDVLLLTSSDTGLGVRDLGESVLAVLRGGLPEAA